MCEITQIGVVLKKKNKLKGMTTHIFMLIGNALFCHLSMRYVGVFKLQNGIKKEKNYGD